MHRVSGIECESGVQSAGMWYNSLVDHNIELEQDDTRRKVTRWEPRIGWKDPEALGWRADTHTDGPVAKRDATLWFDGVEYPVKIIKAEMVYEDLYDVRVGGDGLAPSAGETV